MVERETFNIWSEETKETEQTLFERDYYNTN